jgi:hypothetical protein
VAFHHLSFSEMFGKAEVYELQHSFTLSCSVAPCGTQIQSIPGTIGPLDHPNCRDKGKLAVSHKWWSLKITALANA